MPLLNFHVQAVDGGFKTCCISFGQIYDRQFWFSHGFSSPEVKLGRGTGSRLLGDDLALPDVGPLITGGGQEFHSQRDNVQ
ncbi:hypothetical protein D9M72_326090 [compost metagenome]